MPVPPKLTRSGKKTSPFTIQITYRVFVLTVRIFFFLPESCFPSGVSKKGKGHLFRLVVVSDFWTWFGPLHQFLSCCVSGVFSTCHMPDNNSGPKPWGLSYSESAQMSLLSSRPQEHLSYVSLARPRGGGVFGNLLHHSPLSRQGQPP